MTLQAESSSKHGRHLSRDDPTSSSGSALVSVRDARQQRLTERAGGRIPSARPHTSRVRKEPSLSTSLAAAFKRPAADKLPPSSVLNAAQHVAATLSSAPGYTHTRSASAPSQDAAASQRLVPSTTAGGGQAHLDHSSPRQGWEAAEGSPSNQPTSSGHPLRTPRSPSQSTSSTRSSTMAERDWPHQGLGAENSSIQYGRVHLREAGTAVTPPRPRGSFPGNLPSTAAGSSPLSAGKGSLHLRGAGQLLGGGQALGPSIGSPRGALPAHLSQLLADPAPLLQPLEDGDAALSMLLYEAREDGACRLTMKGLQELPQPLLRFLRVEGMNLRELSLQGNRLTLAPGLELMVNLLTLDLSSNEISHLPDSLESLTRLQSLSLNENHLVHLPPSLTCLTSLTALDLSCNELLELPSGLPAMHRLQHVKVDRNHLHTLPAGLLRLPNLRSLSASHNQLVALSVDLGAAQRLERLSLHHNRITALPDTLGELQHCLTDLLLNDNCMTILPRELARLNRLQRITTACNPLMFPPQSVCRRGLAAIRFYLMQHLDNWSQEADVPQLQQGEGEEALKGAAAEPDAQAAACSRCKDMEVQMQRLGSSMLQIQLERERMDKEVSALKGQLQQRDQLCSQLDKAVKELMADKLASERSLHARSALHLSSAEDLERQVFHMRLALREAEGTASSASERLQEAVGQLEVEKRRAAAALELAGSLQQDSRLMEALQADLLAARSENERLDALAAHHQFQQRASEDRQREAEARADQGAALLGAMKAEQEATHKLLASERAEAGIRAAEAQQREQSLQTDVQHLQAQVAALLSEREELQEQHRQQLAALEARCRGEEEPGHRVVAPDIDTVMAMKREQARRQWRQPQQL